MKPYLPLSTILDELKSHIVQQHTGAFFIASCENTSARLGLKEGEIVCCYCQRYSGKEAVEALQNIKSGRFSFTPSLFPFHQRAKVDSQVTLNTLNIEIPSIHTPENQDKEADKVSIHTHIYRGQVVEIKTPNPSKNKAPKKTSQRYYRGQPLND